MRALWWSSTQVDNVARILDWLKRTYNIDENRVYLTGSSDGGTGVYYMAFRDPTAWASFVPMIGNMLVLGTPSVHTDGEMFPGNAVNRPLYVVNTGRIRLIAHAVEPVRRPSAQARGVRGLSRLRRDGTYNRVVGRRAAGASRRSCWTIRASRCPTGFRGRPSASTGSIARIGSSSISWGRSRERAGWPTATCCHRGRELDFGLRINTSIDRGRRAQEVDGRVECV